MKKALPFILIAASAWAGLVVFGTAPAYWQETQPGTRTLPPDAGDGFALTGLRSFHAAAFCPNGGNITAGSLLAEYEPPAISPLQSIYDAGWGALPSANNCTLGTGASLAICPELEMLNPFGRMLFATSGVTCSGTWDGGVIVTVEANQQ